MAQRHRRQTAAVKHLLLCCWRITLAVLFVALLLPVGAFLYLAPDAESLQPQIEALVAGETGLGLVRLGRLSWHWRGRLWLHSDDFRMATQDRSLRFDHAAIDIRLSLFDLLRGDITPELLRFTGGTMRITPAFLESPLLALPPIPYRFDRLTLRWAAPGLQHDFLIDHFRADVGGGPFALETKALTVRGVLRDDLLPRQAEVVWRTLEWLPAAWRTPWVEGDSRGRITVRMEGERRWRIEGESAGVGGPIVLRPGEGRYPTDHIEGRLYAVVDRKGGLRSLRLERLHWRLGRQEIRAGGEWQAGLATLQARAEHLEMPLVWSWLTPLGGERWRRWLGAMQEGTARDATASITLPWPNPLRRPPQWEGMRYRVDARIEESDIALGLGGARLTGTRGTLHLDQSRLWANVEHATLPHRLGRISGTVVIPWDRLELAIHGSGTTDLERLLHWQGVEERVQWRNAATDATFDMRWRVNAPEPSNARVELRPHDRWQLVFAGIEARMEDGYLLWRPGSLTMHGMTFHIGSVGGECRATLEKRQDGWALTDFLARSRIDLTDRRSIAAPFVQQPRGELQLTLRFDGTWHGLLDAGEAGWSNLLGARKRPGEPLSIRLGEIRFSPDARGRWSVRGISSRGPALRLERAHIAHRDGALVIDLPRLHTRALDGAFHLLLPDGRRKPARLRFTVRRLERDALRPLVDNWRHRAQRRRWLAHGTIDRFGWGDNLRARAIDFRREADGDNRVAIGRLDIEDAQVQSLRARFRLAPDHIDIRELHASVAGQRLMVSALLRRLGEGRWGWSGIAALDGPFGDLMEQLGLSRLFAGGTVHALFNGRGRLVRHQPWWRSLEGRLRMRVDDGRILDSGTLTRLLAATSLFDLPGFILGGRDDLTGKGMLFRHLQLEGNMDRGTIRIHRIAMRASAMDVAGTGSLDIGRDHADVYLVARPLQNLDTIINSIPLVRDILGGPAHSLFRKVYHLHGPLNDARIDPATPKEAGLRSAGVIDTLLNLPTLWFGKQATR
ncbi:MAG: DUF3971 domain-containing protein [Zetaproteobacteria bacterium]|nr:MAG: DUF3971 domain-containing protein [Zetaproteobacteria bacterium]